MPHVNDRIPSPASKQAAYRAFLLLFLKDLTNLRLALRTWPKSGESPASYFRVKILPYRKAGCRVSVSAGRLRGQRRRFARLGPTGQSGRRSRVHWCSARRSRTCRAGQCRRLCRTASARVVIKNLGPELIVCKRSVHGIGVWNEPSGIDEFDGVVVREGERAY